MNKNLVIEKISNFIKDHNDSVLLIPENPTSSLVIEIDLESVPDLYNKIKDFGDPEIEYEELDDGYVEVEFPNLTGADYNDVLN